MLHGACTRRQRPPNNWLVGAGVAPGRLTRRGPKLAPPATNFATTPVSLRGWSRSRRPARYPCKPALSLEQRGRWHPFPPARPKGPSAPAISTYLAANPPAGWPSLRRSGRSHAARAPADSGPLRSRAPHVFKGWGAPNSEAGRPLRQGADCFSAECSNTTHVSSFDLELEGACRPQVERAVLAEAVELDPSIPCACAHAHRIQR